MDLRQTAGQAAQEAYTKAKADGVSEDVAWERAAQAAMSNGFNMSSGRFSRLNMPEVTYAVGGYINSDGQIVKP